MQFTKGELESIRNLIMRANITGGESVPVAMLIQKIDFMVQKEESKEPEKKPKKNAV